MSEAPPVHLGHHEIEQHQANLRIAAKDAKTVGTAGRFGDVKPGEAESLCQRLADVRLVIDDQYAARAATVEIVVKALCGLEVFE
jgi:hypothetical protein